MQKIEFKNLPNTDTPISAENLNAIQDNVENEINDSSVVASPTEPTGLDRKKVWMQKGKNLFDKNNANILNAATSGDTGKIVTNNNMKLIYVPCKPNTTYTSQKIQGQNNNLSYTKELPKVGVGFYGRVLNMTGTTCTITTGADAKYLVLVILNLEVETSLTLEQVLNSIQIEQGSTATQYEPYVENKIYIKNDDDVYEEFMKKEEIQSTYSTDGNVIKFSDGTMICFVTRNFTTDEQYGVFNYRYPVPFKETPTATVLLGRPSDYSVVTCNINDVTTTLLQVTVRRIYGTAQNGYVSGSATNLTLNNVCLTIIGKWK